LHPGESFVARRIVPLGVVSQGAEIEVGPAYGKGVGRLTTTIAQAGVGVYLAKIERQIMTSEQTTDSQRD
jgi:hypothetical protein